MGDDRVSNIQNVSDVFRIVIEYTPGDFVRLFEDDIWELKDVKKWTRFADLLYFRGEFFDSVLFSFERLQNACQVLGWPPSYVVDYVQKFENIHSGYFNDVMSYLARTSHICPKTSFYPLFKSTIESLTTESHFETNVNLLKRLTCYRDMGFGPSDLRDQGRSITRGVYLTTQSLPVLRYLQSHGYELCMNDFQETASFAFMQAAKHERRSFMTWMRDMDLLPILTSSQKAVLKRRKNATALAFIRDQPTIKKQRKT